METPEQKGIVKISKNSLYLSFGMVFTICVVIFWAGYSLASTTKSLENHQNMPFHSGVEDNFVRKSELTLQLKIISGELKSINTQLKDIKKEIGK